MKLPNWLRGLRARLWWVLKWSLWILSIMLAWLLIPVGHVEFFCRGTANDDAYRPLITNAAFHRREANTYLT